MSRFKRYSPEQAYLLPPSVKDVLGEGHLCFFVQQVVERLDMSAFEQAYSAEGGELYAVPLMLSVWLYAYATGLTSARELQRRIKEDLPLRYLAGGETPDDWALSAFRRRHPRAINDVFTQTLELVRDGGLGKFGVVAVDSTPIAAHNSKQRVDTRRRLREQRLKYRRQVRHWQKQCAAAEPVVAEYAAAQLQHLQQCLAELPPRLRALKKSGQPQLPRTDPEARVLRKNRRSIIGYTAEVAVSQDHFIVAQRVTQQKTDNDSLLPMLDEVKHQCGARPHTVLADAGYYKNSNLRQLEAHNITGYIPDSNMAAALNRGGRVHGRARAPEMQRMRRRLRTPEGRKWYAQRKAIVEGAFGTLKSERDLHRFRLCGVVKVGIEFALGAIGHNLTRWHAERNPNSPLWCRRRRRESKRHRQKPGREARA
jgi:transposase